MKRPRSPPQSATKLRFEYDHSSFWTANFNFRLANFTHIILDVTFSRSNVITCSNTYSYTNVSNISAILDKLPSQTVCYYLEGGVEPHSLAFQYYFFNTLYSIQMHGFRQLCFSVNSSSVDIVFKSPRYSKNLSSWDASEQFSLSV